MELEEDTSTLYDSIKFERIGEQLSKLDFSDQIDLLGYFKRKLKVAGYDSYSLKASRLEYDLKIKHYKKGWYKISNLFNLLSLFPLNGLRNILISFIALYIIFSIFMLPAFCDFFAVYDIKYHNYSSNFLTNHFTNTIGFLFGIESEFKVSPNGISGVVLSVFVKINFIIYVVNILFVKALEYLKQ